MKLGEGTVLKSAAIVGLGRKRMLRKDLLAKLLIVDGQGTMEDLPTKVKQSPPR